jgi:DNA-binding LacI/PurR family transcriptional regulator
VKGAAADEGQMSVARVTLQTIADRVGVSRMTVSNAFSRPDQLSPALRARILTAADELGYAGPDPAARALAKGSTGAIGVLLTDSLQVAFTDEFATGFLAAVAGALGPTGLALTLLTTSPEQQAVIPARDVAMDGALIYSCNPQSPAAAWLRRRNLPMVLVDQEPEAGIPSVNIDDRGGARAGAQHVLDLGHRRIGILSSSAVGPFGQITAAELVGLSNTTQARLDGWLDVLLPAGVTPVILQQPPYAPETEAAAARQLLALPDQPTAVLCFSDAIAATMVRTAQDAGLRVPQDLSVVGFDDSPVATRLKPTLTTVHQDVTAKGRAAVAALTAEIGRRAAGDKGRSSIDGVLLPTQLVVRDSTTSAPIH